MGVKHSSGCSSRTAHLGAAALLFCAGSTLAQTAHIIHTLRWLEVDALTNTPITNPNGVLEPGEGARVIVDTTFTPPVGSPHTYSYPEPGGVGILKGIGGTTFDLLGTGGTHGDWSHFQRNAIFTAGSMGIPDPNGSIFVIAMNQLGIAPNPLNPIVGAWQSVWTPALYSHRNVGFAMQMPMHYPGDAVWVEYGTDPTTGNPLHSWVYVPQTFGASVQIPIVPAPGSAPFLLGAAMAAFRRNRSPK